VQGSLVEIRVEYKPALLLHSEVLISPVQCTFTYFFSVNVSSVCL